MRPGSQKTIWHLKFNSKVFAGEYLLRIDHYNNIWKSYVTICVFCVLCRADCQSPCPEELGGGVPHVAIVPMKATNSSQKEIIAGEERPKYFAANKIDNNQGEFLTEFPLDHFV